MHNLPRKQTFFFYPFLHLLRYDEKKEKIRTKKRNRKEEEEEKTLNVIDIYFIDHQFLIDKKFLVVRFHDIS